MNAPLALHPHAVARRAPARLLAVGPHGLAALPAHTVVELVEHLVLLPVPGAPPYCDGLARWQGQWLPVVDLQRFIHGAGAGNAAAARYHLIVAYQMAPGAALQHGVLGLHAAPRETLASDEAYCALPTNSARWPAIAISCFAHEGQAVPVIDTARLFGQMHG